MPAPVIIVSGDSAYGGRSVLQNLPRGVDLITRVASNAALYEPAPPLPPKQKRARQKKGHRPTGDRTILIEPARTLTGG
jgi:hypothetical protein